MMSFLQKLEKWFFYLLIFFLPWQARIIFKSWGSGFNEWDSIAFYLTDALLLIVIFLWAVRIFKKNNSPRPPLNLRREERGVKRFGKIEIALFIFLGISALSLINAQNFWLGVFREIKLIELGLLFLWVKNNFFLFCNSLRPPLNLRGGEGGVIIRVSQVLLASGLLQALIAVGQFVRQKSFGLSFLDESPLGVDISGVAKIVIDGEKLIRPYGLTPHPNVLAAFLLIAIFCALVLFIQRNRDYKWGWAIFYTLSIAILTFAFFLTFSRSVITIGLLAIFGWLAYQFFKSGRRWYILNTIAIFAAACVLAVIFLWPFLSARFDIEHGLADQSFNLRVFYNQVAFNFVAQNPILGVGIGNFVWAFQQSSSLSSSENWMYQPVHNIYLLIASETGTFGLLAFLAFLFFTLKGGWPFRKDFIVIGQVSLVIGLLVIGLFDHFLWDLQQGQLMLWIALGILTGFAVSPYGSTDPAQNLPS